jgi:hypothetical protein
VSPMPRTSLICIAPHHTTPHHTTHDSLK